MGVVASLVTLCLPLLTRARAKTARKETFWPNLFSPSISHIPGACCD